MTSTLRTISFWADAAERAVKTAAQAAISGLALSETGFGNAFSYDWALAGQFALTGAVLSVLTSIVSAPIGQSGTASVLPPPIGPVAPPDPPGG